MSQHKEFSKPIKRIEHLCTKSAKEKCSKEAGPEKKGLTIIGMFELYA
jgi:hypothetical protein